MKMLRPVYIVLFILLFFQCNCFHTYSPTYEPKTKKLDSGKVFTYKVDPRGSGKAYKSCYYIDASPDRVWEGVKNPNSYPRKNIKSREIISEDENHWICKEMHINGAIQHSITWQYTINNEQKKLSFELKKANFWGQPAPLSMNLDLWGTVTVVPMGKGSKITWHFHSTGVYSYMWTNLLNLNKLMEAWADEHQQQAFSTAKPTRIVASVETHKEIPQAKTKNKQIQPTRSFAVVIGISKYKYAGKAGLTNLIYADNDARAFSEALKNKGWDENNIKLLINEQATQRNILIALESWLTKAGPDDLIVLYWSGHGFPDPEDPEMVYFSCYDTDLRIPATGYRMDKVRKAVEERKGRNVIVLADTCHAGKLITRGGKGLSVTPYMNKLQREKRIPKGWIFMVSAATDRQAIEHTSWSNGAFTYCLLKALAGEADGYMSAGKKDDIITMGEIRYYINNMMPEETQRILGVAKRPMIITSSSNPEIWDLDLMAK